MFDLYLALGDSMSIDFYPAQDAQRRGVSNREELGAASLFFENDSELFPEFIGRDLRTMFPKISYENLAFDGATTEDWLSPKRLHEIAKHFSSRVLVTLTLGGNDLLQAFRWNGGGDEKSLESAFQQTLSRYRGIIDSIKQKLPQSVLIVSTVFDPTDGTGIIPVPNAMWHDKPLPVQFLSMFNSFILSMKHRQTIYVADVYKHFEGHGATCGADENFWYWKPSPIEPSYKGASEIRRIWLETIMSVPSDQGV